MAKSRSQEIPNRHCRQPVLRLPGLKPNKILLCHVNLRGVLNQQDSFLLRDEFSEDVQEGRFATSCSACNEDVLASQHIIFKLVGKPALQGPSGDEIVDTEMTREGYLLDSGSRNM